MKWEIWLGISIIVFIIVFQHQIQDGCKALWSKVWRKREDQRANGSSPAQKNPLELLEQRIREAVTEVKDYIEKSNRDQAKAIVKATNYPVLTERATDYVPNVLSNTPDWRKWTDTTPEGYPIQYDLMTDPEDSAKSVPDLSKGYYVNYLGIWVHPEDVAAMRKEFLTKEAALNK